MIPPVRWPVLVALIACAFVGGVYTGYRHWKPPAPVLETAAPAQRQADSSLVLERKPDPTATPKQIVPKGATVARVVSLTVRPHPVPASALVLTPDSGNPVVNQLHTDSVQCRDVTVDLSLFRMPDRSYRVGASSRDGDVVGGLDVPVEPVARDRVRRWAIGPSWNRAQWKPTGAFVDRDVGPVRIGISVHTVRDSVIALPQLKIRVPTRGAFEVRVGLPF